MPDPSIKDTQHVSHLTRTRMKAVRRRNTKPELILRNALREAGLSGYRLHRKDLPGSPDIAWVGKKIAVFVNGCFWHRCSLCNPSFPKTNQEFWKTKFKRNVDRDTVKTEQLRNLGWTVIVVWQCEIEADIQNCVERVKRNYQE